MTDAAASMALVRLVIPAYREGGRLPRFLGELLGALADAPWRTEILVVDDGSPAADQAALVRLIAREAATAGNVVVREPLLLPDNRRKGGAILAGWRAVPSSAESAPTWLAFVDADGAVSAGEVRRALAAALVSGEARAVFAIRDPASVRARAWSRRLASALFASYASALLGIPIADFQCGFKILPARVFAALDAELGESGFCLDLELRARLLARGVGIVEHPVAWVERAGGHTRLWRQAPRMAAAVWRLRRGVVL